MQANISSIKEMMIEMLQAFKGMSSSTPLGSTSIPTAIQPEVNAFVRGDEKLEKQVVVPQAQITGLVIDITLPSQPESSQGISRINKGKEKVTNDTDEPTRKLVPSSRKVRHDPDALTLVHNEINGKMYQLTEEEIQVHLDKEKMIKKAVEKAKLIAMTKCKLIKVVHEEASKARINPKTLKSAKGGQEFKKIQDAKMKSALLASTPEQGASQLSERKRKKMKLEPEIRIPTLECNISLPKGVLFVNNMVI
nr:hypothetical protein [Tanacetum cinerariifolium]